MSHSKKHTYAIWAITPNGLKLARKIASGLSDGDIFASHKLTADGSNLATFQSLSTALADVFYHYTGHIFIMSAGIVVRIIAAFIRSKLEDPAVVVVDDQGKHAISLLSGHLGGANALTLDVAGFIGAHPVITTATDVNQIAAIDVLAKEKHLTIENPQAIKTVNMALLKGEPICLHDPFGLMPDSIFHSIPWPDAISPGGTTPVEQQKPNDDVPRIFIDDLDADLPSSVLILRPPTLIAGIGCNRNTPMEEIEDLLENVLEKFRLSSASLSGIASIKLKADEPGLLALAARLDLPLYFYDKAELNRVAGIQNPSSMVKKHIGVKSVCEAAAILAAQNGNLVVPKQTNRNATLAIARKSSIS